MKRILLFSFALITLASCEKDKPGLTSICADYTRSAFVWKELAMIRIQKINGQQTGGYVILPLSESFRSYVVSWDPCNLPVQFQKDTLDIIVSGYKLKRPGSQSINTTAIPFEITAIQLR
jgi:hypothetical protein